MAEIQLTPAQRMAVENRGGRLLVSAAAGSGKTKVLVERLFSYIEEGANVDDFLMITYTNAAAAELRSKIAGEISRRVAARPEDQHLRRQLFRVYQADIKTVDAFCVGLLRENVYRLRSQGQHSLTPDFRVMDNQETALLKQRVLERVLEDFYTDMDDNALALAETLGAGRDDSALEQLVLELHGKLQSHPYPLTWLAGERKRWEELPADLLASDFGKILRQEALHIARFWEEHLRRAVDDMEGDEEVYRSHAAQFLEVAEQLLDYENVARSWESMASAVPKFRTMGRCGDSEGKVIAKAVLDKCKKDFNKIRDTFSVPQEKYREDLAAMAPAMLALVRLTEDFIAAYQTEKVRRNCVDFSDQEHYAIELLLEDGHPTQLARQVAERYREIMVDEYQDSNEVQDHLFRAVSRETKNLFTVGDMKQSIYRFRLADPGIFLRAYQEFKDAAQAEEHEPRKVLLSSNFRSRKEVLDTTNFIFRNIMSPEAGEMAYGPAEQLNYGAEYYLPRTDCAAEFHFIDVKDTEEETFDTHEVEAAFVAKRIRELLDSGFPVQQGDGFRPCTPEDIVILMRSPKSRMKTYLRALERQNIPCGSEEGGGFFDTVEISAIYSLLQIIDNPHQDVPLIAALRSPLFGFTPDRLAMIRANGPGDFYEALCRDEGEDSTAFLQGLEKLRQAACEETADVLLWHLYDFYHVLAVFGTMDGGARRRSNLLAFYSYAQDMVRLGRKSLFDFVEYLRSLLERDDLPPLGGKQSSGGVSIMTIHSSKGLEFPIVILCDLHTRFNTKDMSAPVLVHPQLGLGPNCVDRARRIKYPTVGKQALQRQLLLEAKSEEMRVLYVAMTRAKEKLILVECMKKGDAYLKKLGLVSTLPLAPEVAADAVCPGDWLATPLLSTLEGAPLRRLAELPMEHLQETDGGWEVHVWENPVGKETGQDLGILEDQTVQVEPEPDTALLEGIYDYTSATVLPTKVTATQLKGREVDEELAQGAETMGRRGQTTFERPQFLQKSVGLNPAERGTAMHLLMQYLDFSAGAEDVQTQIAQLQEKHLLTAEQASAIDVPRITAFLSSPLCQRIRRAQQVYREYRFTVKIPARRVWPNAPEGEEIMLQGVTDCAFVEDGELVIVDFKTDHVTAQTIAQRTENYRPQLEAYAYALSQVLEIPVKEKVLYFFHTNSSINL